MSEYSVELPDGTIVRGPDQVAVCQMLDYVMHNIDSVDVTGREECPTWTAGEMEAYLRGAQSP